MKQKDIVIAYKAITNFNQNEKNKKNASVRTTHDLFIIKKLLEPHWQYQSELERDIFQETEAKMLENGDIEFKSQEQKDKFFEKLNEVSNLDIDLGDFTKVKIKLDEDINIPMDDMEALDPFVEFVE